MPDIQTLTSLVQKLESEYSWWNNTTLWLIAATALVAALYFIASLITSNRANQLKNAQAALIRAKDEQLTSDLKDKDKQIADVNDSAAKASDSASQANVKAQELEKQNIQLRTDLETVTAESSAKQTELAREQSKLAQEQRKTAEAQREAAEAQLALKKHLDEEIERRKPRHLTMEQQARLTEALKRSPVKGLVEVECVLGDGEGVAFASEIDGVLKAAGWPTTGVSQGVFTPNNPIGFGIVVHSGQTAPKHAGFLQSAFTAGGFPIQAIEQAGRPEGSVLLLIGNKP